MVVLNPVAATLGIGQLGMGIYGAFDEQQQYLNEVYQASYANALSRQKTEMMNAYRMEAYGRQIEFAEQQQEFNADAANRAYITEQARFNEQVAQFAFNQVNFEKDLKRQQGVYAASEQYGSSSQRVAQLDTLGQFGRNQAVLAKSLASAAQQSQRNLEEIGRNWQQADYQVYGSVMQPPLLEMAEPLYQPGYGPNMALSIGGSLLSSTETFFTGAQFD